MRTRWLNYFRKTVRQARKSERERVTTTMKSHDSTYSGDTVKNTVLYMRTSFATYVEENKIKIK